MAIKRKVGTVVEEDAALPITAAKRATVGPAHEVEVAESVVAVLRPGSKPPGDDDGPPGPAKQTQNWPAWITAGASIIRLVLDVTDRLFLRPARLSK